MDRGRRGFWVEFGVYKRGFHDVFQDLGNLSEISHQLQPLKGGTVYLQSDLQGEGMN